MFLANAIWVAVRHVWSQRSQPPPFNRVWSKGEEDVPRDESGAFRPGDYGDYLVDDDGVRWRRNPGSFVLTMVED